MKYDQALIDALHQARHVVILTGAGVSAESGIPTFRDRLTGLWEKFSPGQLASPQAFDTDPALVWGWYEWRRMMVMRASPNAAHRAIAAMADLVPHFTLITQNVDDLHERAGSAQVLHLHGRLAAPYCEGCRGPYRAPPEVPDLPSDGARIDPPRCDRCGARIRPGVVWFGEGLPERDWQEAVAAVGRCDVFFSIGTSAIVAPAASLVGMAAQRGAVTVQVNLNPTGADTVVSYSLRGPAGAVLPELVTETWGIAVESR